MLHDFPATVDDLLEIHYENLTKNQLIYLVSQYRLDIQGNWYQLGMVINRLHFCMRKGEFIGVLKSYNIGSGTAIWLREMAAKFFTMKQVPPQDLPWRKLAEVYRLMNTESYDRMITFCEGKSARELQIARLTNQLAWV